MSRTNQHFLLQPSKFTQKLDQQIDTINEII
jgi:hypothetical protein